jgi:alcohol dehydrogenase (cytochrome c)
MTRIIWKVFAVSTILVIGLGGGAYYYVADHYSKANTVTPLAEIISRRARVLLNKAFGKIPELSWIELWKMTTREGGFSLGMMAEWGQSMDAVLVNPYTSREDLKAGGQLFREHCARCHGADGAGYLGPALARVGYKNGDSDLAIYRVLRDGVPGTPMEPTHLSFTEKWQTVGYLRKLQFHLDNDGGDDEFPY